MKPSTRIIFNTSIQYVRTVISVLVTLYTARLILDALGVEDYLFLGRWNCGNAFLCTNLTDFNDSKISVFPPR